ncbi:alpha/beta hydrolase [Methylosinus sp. H3A]|uniref:alpha/beta fold hydrolase n=1 Tax=Methylosinus sp. H3A TaxID=2785786 RepID=UPI0018C20C6E|nr:alpha/beta hydrolase [Methylosinus sp. H3A]MBG0812050.1 alpha/beta hydrolase [Methylosinus sp. H3A]
MTIDRRVFLAAAGAAAAQGFARAQESGGRLSDGLLPERLLSERLLPEGAQSRFFEVDGLRLHHVALGAGPPVVLLHGWPQTWFAWRATMERLSRRFTVIAPDLRGLGSSERSPSGYDKRSIAEDIAALIDRVAGGRAHVIGHDMGGKAAYVLALLHPAKVARLILVDCLVPGTENMDARRGGAWHYGFHMAREIPELLTQGRERDYIAAQIRAWSFRKDAVSEAAITEFARHYARPGGMTAGFDYYRALPEDARFVQQLADRRLDMPALAIAGRHGVGARLAEALRPQASALSSIIVEESGHFVADEAPEIFWREVERFLAA